MTYRSLALAKVNLSLDIVGKRADGYHELQSVMQTLDLADVVEVRMARQTSVWATDEALPCDETNLAWRAWQLMADKYQLDVGVDIRLEKHIPLGGGMAGGSTDAAQVLLAIDELFALHLSNEELVRLAAQLGADVPYCLFGGTVLARGIGERLTKLADCPELRLVLVHPGFAVPTPAVYRQYDALGLQPTYHTARMISALDGGNPWQIAESMGNALEPAAFALYPPLARLKAEMLSLGLVPLLSGSGATVFGVARDKKQAAIAAEAFEGCYPFVQSVTTY